MEIKYFEKLSCLKFSDEDVCKYKKHIEDMLSVIDKIKEYDGKNGMCLKETPFSRLRTDEVSPSLCEKNMMSDTEDGFFVTLKVVE